MRRPRLYAFREPGIEPARHQPRLRATAFTLYGGILDAVEAAHYHVLTERVSVPMTRRLAVALPAARRARAARRAQDRWVAVA